MNPMYPSTLYNFTALWLIVSAGTFCLISAFIISAFKHGGVDKFKRLNISYPALGVIIVIMSILFPIAWYMIHRLIKEAP